MRSDQVRSTGHDAHRHQDDQGSHTGQARPRAAAHGVRDQHRLELRQRALASDDPRAWPVDDGLRLRSVRQRRRQGVRVHRQLHHPGSLSAVRLEAPVRQRAKLRWRKSFGERRSLGWVPFKARATKPKNGQVFFAGHHFKVWDSYGLSRYTFRAGCFAEDARGRWYLCVVVEAPVAMSTGQGAVGIDLGLKSAATCSDGTALVSREYRDIEARLAAAQRARKTARVRALHAKARNRRRDAQHKFSTAVVSRYNEVYVGNVSSTKLTRTRMAKSTLDASWASLKTMLDYKARQRGILYREVNEAHTTRGCSDCGCLTGPHGLTGLSVRDWRCSACGAEHQRDVNAARNICRLGLGHQPP